MTATLRRASFFAVLGSFPLTLTAATGLSTEDLVTRALLEELAASPVFADAELVRIGFVKRVELVCVFRLKHRVLEESCKLVERGPLRLQRVNE